MKGFYVKNSKGSGGNCYISINVKSISYLESEGDFTRVEFKYRSSVFGHTFCHSILVYESIDDLNCRIKNGIECPMGYLDVQSEEGDIASSVINMKEAIRSFYESKA